MKEELLEFGTKRENEERRDGGCGVVFDPETQMYAVGRNIGDKLLRLFGGGFDEGEDEKEGVLREVTEESGLYDFLHVERIDKVLAHYHNRAKNKDRIAEATCFLVILKSKNLMETKLEEHEKFHLDWVTYDELVKCFLFRNTQQDFEHWLYFLKKAVNRAKELGYDKTSVIK